jgi:hypothetical protein
VDIADDYAQIWFTPDGFFAADYTDEINGFIRIIRGIRVIRGKKSVRGT